MTDLGYYKSNDKRYELSEKEKQHHAEKGTFWNIISKAFAKDTGGCGDPYDPEYDCQKIYTHYMTNLAMYHTWIKLFG